MSAELFFVRRGPMQYGPKAPEDVLDLDQIFSLKGMANDESLVRLGFVAAVSPRARIVQCGQCGTKFISDHGLSKHGRRVHDRSTGDVVADAVRASNDRILRDLQRPQQVADVTEQVNASEDIEERRETAQLDSERPINWHKTKAAQKAGDAPIPEVRTRGGSEPEKFVRKKAKPRRPRGDRRDVVDQRHVPARPHSKDSRRKG